MVRDRSSRAGDTRGDVGVTSRLLWRQHANAFASLGARVVVSTVAHADARAVLRLAHATVWSAFEALDDLEKHARFRAPERDFGRAAERLLRVRQRELRSRRLQQNFRRPERLGERKRDVIELALRHPARRSLDVDPRCARSVFRPLVRAQTVPSPRRRDPLRRRPARYLARRVRPLLTRRVPRRFDAILRPVTPIAPVALRRRRVARPESVQRQRRFRRRARALTLLARSRRARAKPRRPRARELPHIERPSRRAHAVVAAEVRFRPDSGTARSRLDRRGRRDGTREDERDHQTSEARLLSARARHGGARDGARDG